MSDGLLLDIGGGGFRFVKIRRHGNCQGIDHECGKLIERREVAIIHFRLHLRLRGGGGFLRQYGFLGGIRHDGRLSAAETN